MSTKDSHGTSCTARRWRTCEALGSAVEQVLLEHTREIKQTSTGKHAKAFSETWHIHAHIYEAHMCQFAQPTCRYTYQYNGILGTDAIAKGHKL